MSAEPMVAATPPAPHSEIRGKLWIAFVLQIAAISVATLLSVYGAWTVLRDVLIQQALVDETRHYWERVAAQPDAPLPDTYNMQGYMAGRGPGPLPAALRDLEPGYHAANVRGGNDLVYVSDGATGRLYLVFEQEQVDRLALWFGFVPLTVVLAVIYITTWLTYRVSRQAISPVIWLANQVRHWDPKRPDFHALAPSNLPTDADGDVQVLAGALHTFAHRIEAFVERERDFTRDASHELRSPLTVIRVAADVLLADGELTAFGERSVNRIQRAARDMEALIESFLILAREGNVGLPEEDFRVDDVVAEEVDKAQAVIAGKPVTLSVVVRARFALRAPRRVLEVMLANLLRNACLYTERGTVTVYIDEESVCVADTGPGIAAEDLARVFQPFYRARGNDAGGGHGVGLSIVKRLSDRFGWPVVLESRVGEGTRAIIRFPHPQPA